MFQYANTFTCTSNPEIGEFLITFRQQYPELDEEGKVSSFSAEPVAEIIVNRSGFDALRNLLNQISPE